ncbi:MAG: hypothetical protein L6R19_03275 [Alphaproteobacteria bacterium]|nr:hypothetical protein [Alphaproteobacteria bacterium]
MSIAGPAAKEKARLIIPFWGAAYLEKMVNITIPALLAPGNLPAMAESFDVEVVLVTERALRPELVKSRAYANLRKICAIDIRFLDDLVTGVPGDYGVVLSYALYRGFTDLGERMLDTFLMFLNADFIIADGSYRTLARLMKEGHRVIHAPSFRANQEDVMPVLRSRLEPESTTLAMPPREMVGLALKYKHLTVRARTVNQRLYHQWRMDQFYWYVDDATLIGYQWPVALLAIKPERVLIEPTLMWDYAFIPDAAPTLPRHFVSDSDDFFMLEPQSRRSGEEMLRLGWISYDEIAKDLSNWTTKEQRDCGRQLLVFHSRDLPDLGATIAESRAYMDEIYKRLSPEPRPHIHHPLFDTWFTSVQERVRANIREGRPLAPPTGSLRIEYAGSGRVTGTLPAAADRATVSDGTPVLACTFVPKTAQSVLQVGIRAAVHSSHATTAVLALYRGDEAAPVSLVTKRVLAGIRAELSLDADLTTHGPMALDLQARIGVDGDGELSLDMERPATMLVTDIGHGAGASPVAAKATSTRPGAPSSRRDVVEHVLRSLYRAIFGKIPHVRRTHPIWQDVQFVASRLRALWDQPDRRMLLVAPHDSLFRSEFSERIDTAQLKGSFSPEGRESQYDLCVVDLTFDDPRELTQLYALVRPIMKPGSTVIAFVLSRNFKGFSVSDSEVYEKILPASDISQLHFFGDARAVVFRRIFKWVTSELTIPWLLRDVAIGATLVLLAPFVWHANRRGRARDSTRPIRPWTSIAIVLTVR